MMRRAADLHVYALLLPWWKAWIPFFGRTPLQKYGVEVGR
jgi:hypothetical protein